MDDAGRRRRRKREKRRKKRRMSCRGTLHRTGSKHNKLVGLIYSLAGLDGWIANAAEKLSADFKKSRRMETGWFIFKHSVLFDFLGCINVLKNLKCLDKLKSESISFAAKQLLSPRGTSPPGDSGAMHAADRSLQPPAPVPQQPSHAAATPFPT